MKKLDIEKIKSEFLVQLFFWKDKYVYRVQDKELEKLLSSIRVMCVIFGTIIWILLFSIFISFVGSPISECMFLLK